MSSSQSTQSASAKPTIKQITDTPSLQSFCDRIADHEYITVDTEFLREKTYYAKLCLIQVAAPGFDTVALIDPLADGIDLSPLWALFRDESILKVMHACDQDMEIFYKEMDGDLPKPIFDTQVGGMFCGLGHQIGYSGLIRHYCDQSLSKDKQYTNWSRRPLDQRSLEYAAADVTWLRDAFETMREELREMDRLRWVKEEIAPLAEPDSYAPDPTERARRIKHRLRDSKAVTVIHALAEWREEKAIEKDRPRNFILKDNTIVEIASSMPKKVQDFSQHRHQDSKRWREELFEIVENVRNGKIAPVAQPPRRRRPSATVKNITDMLNLALKCCARQNQLVPHLIANKDALQDLASGQDHDELEFMRGWRGELFGDLARKIMRGETTIGVKKGEIIFR